MISDDYSLLMISERLQFCQLEAAWTYLWVSGLMLSVEA